jgi:hypothetical protein
MKKYLLAALVGGSLAVPTAVQAVGDPNGYANAGQCQSALMRLRNEGRKDTTAGSDGARYTNQEYNSKTKANFECQERNGRYYIVQVDSQ